MIVEITITYARSKRVEVPAELAPGKDWIYPNREKFDEWVSEQADALAKEEEDAELRRMRLRNGIWVSAVYEED